MPTVVLRISLICRLFNSLLLHFLPKRLRALLPRSWLPAAQPEIETRKAPAPANLSRPNLGASPPSSSSFLPSWGQSPMDESDEKGGSPEMDPAELKRVFQMFDRNGDGHITKKELSDSLENLGIYIPDGDLAAMIEKIDVNRDGCVDMDEFGALYRTIMDERDEEEDMREAFNVFDQNGDGFITVEELRSVLASLGLKQGRTVDDCRRMIRKVDVDGDGMVDFKEFKQMMRGGGFAALS